MLKFLMWDTVTEERKASSFSVPEFRSGTVAIPEGSTQVTVNYSSNISNASSFVVVCQWVNSVDAYPQIQPTIVRNESTSGFIVMWNAPTDSANYKINWHCFIIS